MEDDEHRHLLIDKSVDESVLSLSNSYSHVHSMRQMEEVVVGSC